MVAARPFAGTFDLQAVDFDIGTLDPEGRTCGTTGMNELGTREGPKEDGVTDDEFPLVDAGGNLNCRATGCPVDQALKLVKGK